LIFFFGVTPNDETFENNKKKQKVKTKKKIIQNADKSNYPIDSAIPVICGLV